MLRVRSTARPGNVSRRVLSLLGGVILFIVLAAALAVWSVGRFAPSLLDSTLSSKSGAHLAVENNGTNLFAGRVSFEDFTVTNPSRWTKPMAVTGAKRLPALKDVPTMAEQGFSDFVLRSFDGMTVKTGTPKEVVERLNAELNKALNLPDVRERLAALALETEPMSSAQFGNVIAAETDKWQRIGRAAQIKAD